LAKVVNGNTTEFRYDGEDLILQLDGDGNVAGSWTFGPGIDEPLAMNRAGVNHYYLAEGLGSVTALTDETGAVVHTYEYGVFGEITGQTGSLENPFAYTGREWEPEVGLYYYRARWFDPDAGRFASEDPLGLHGWDDNLFRYVINNPIAYVDPTGFLWETRHVLPEGSPLNTIVCDGQGGITSHVGSPGYTENQVKAYRDCIQAHENVHRMDALQSDSHICEGKPQGTLVAPADKPTKFDTEMRAHFAEVECLKKKLQDCDECDEECRCFIEQRIEIIGGRTVGELGNVR
jgi:RHS repeat-associated protein